MRNKRGVFKQTNVLVSMLFLRQSGWSLKDIAYLFGCDHSSVRRMCQKYRIESPLRDPPPRVRFIRVQYDWNGERLSRGKTYQEYLVEAAERKAHQERERFGDRIKELSNH